MLKIEDLHVEVDGKPILKGINLEVEPGRALVLQGILPGEQTTPTTCSGQSSRA